MGCILRLEHGTLETHLRPRMPTPTLDFKIAFLEGLLSQVGEQPIRILDMGCGTV